MASATPDAKPDDADGVDGVGRGIAKNSYQRHRHPKVHCSQCIEHPDGFRGEHELRRHIDTKHTTEVKKWVPPCGPLFEFSKPLAMR